MSAHVEHVGDITLTFIAATGGWIASREGFDGVAATRGAAVADLNRVIAQARWEGEEADREMHADLFYLQVDPAYCDSAIEVASWD